MEGFYKDESNENTKAMMRGYINLIKTLEAKRSSVRRFFVIPYIPHAGVTDISFSDVDKQLSEKKLNVRDYLKPCGNIVVDTAEASDTEYVLNVLYTCINKHTCAIQKFTCKVDISWALIGMRERLSDMAKMVASHSVMRQGLNC